MNTEAVLNAIYSRLSGYTALSSWAQSIGSEHPQDGDAGDASAFPYVTFSEVDSVNFDTKGTNGAVMRIQVTPWARGDASKSAKAQAAEGADIIHAALHDYALTVSGSNVVNCLWASSAGVLDDPDGVTKYKPMDFRIQHFAT